ncbi:hypothetical protein GCM10007981_09150 [Thermocladium modestius]|uniref:YbaK/aminoacyl-tRNA synthetase-associated domain-containing protein n=1 Tax=Thermocladium modestius TaxID=62609 RepID=A0A830GWB8_9CREN|nr:YbaK/EbsC family protein [Thermocladium modestius]GGP20563.1 hypothetical protein GCM10007981_09150 [Thermocladium modestius]
MKGPSDLESFIKRNGIMATLMVVGDAATSMKAAASLGIDIDRIMKTVIFLDDLERPLAVMLRGSRKVNQNALAKQLGARKIRLAAREEVVKLTGYEAGGVPPIDLPLDSVLDSELASMGGVVYAGGGDSRTLLEISIEDIIRLQHPRILSVSIPQQLQ